MEGEGSGYDLIYEKLSRDAKKLPVIESTFSKTIVTVYSTIIDDEAISVIDYINNHYNLTQKENITLGIIAAEKKILSTQLSNKLQLNQEDKLKYWIMNLLDKKIVISRGGRKATEYLLNPEVFSQAKLNLKPSLKTIEPLKLRALIVEDLKYNGFSKMVDIQKRLSDALPADVKKAVYKMVEDKELTTTGAKKNRTYEISKKNK